MPNSRDELINKFRDGRYTYEGIADFVIADRKRISEKNTCRCKGEILFSGGYGEPKICVECKKEIIDEAL